MPAIQSQEITSKNFPDFTNKDTLATACENLSKLIIQVQKNELGSHSKMIEAVIAKLSEFKEIVTANKNLLFPHKYLDESIHNVEVCGDNLRNHLTEETRLLIAEHKSINWAVSFFTSADAKLTNHYNAMLEKIFSILCTTVRMLNKVNYLKNMLSNTKPNVGEQSSHFNEYFRLIYLLVDKAQDQVSVTLGNKDVQGILTGLEKEKTAPQLHI